jgi:pilus assembly protein CpaF
MINIEIIYEDGRQVQCQLMPPIKIGRDASCSLRINNWRVAKEHAMIDLLGNVIQIEDYGSLGGTRVNQKRVAQYAPILPDDVVQIGPCRLQMQAVFECLVAVQSVQSSTSFSGDQLTACSSDAQTVAPSSDVQIFNPIVTNEENNHHKLLTSLDSLDPAFPAISESGVCRLPTSLNDQRESNHSSIVFDDVSNTKQANQSLSEARAIFQAKSLPFALPISEDIRKSIHTALVRELDVQKRDLSKLPDALLREQCKRIVEKMLLRDHFGLDPAQQKRLVYEVVSDAVGLGVLQSLIDDPSVSEILVNRFDHIFVEKNGQLIRHDAQFASDEALRTVIERIVMPIGRRIDDASPMVDARLQDGSRVNAVIAPVSIGGACLTIRKFPSKRLNLNDLVQFKTLDQKLARFIKCCVEQRLSMLISGGTGSGKTTLLNILASQVPAAERIITIEDAAELQISHPHVLSLESKPGNTEGKGQVTIRDLVKNALRMRPDRIVVGECRGAEAVDMLAAMNTGHAGSLTTLHANSPRDALSRLETMVLMAGMSLPLPAIRDQIGRAVQLIIQQIRLPCGRRVVSAIDEVTGMESGQIQTQPIMRFKVEKNLFCMSTIPPSFLNDWRQAGVTIDADWFGPYQGIEQGR